jgi:transposase
MKRIHRVILSTDERSRLLAMISSGTGSARSFKRAQMLLKADESPAGEGWTDERIGEALDVHPMTVLYVRRRYVQRGLDAVLRGTYTGHNPAIVTGEVEAQLIALACSAPPSGREHWTLQLLAERLVALEIVDRISDETVRLALKKTQLSHGASKNGVFRRKRMRLS